MVIGAFLRCVCSSQCEDLVTLSEDFYRECLCLTVCDLGTSTNSHPSLQFGLCTTESDKVYLQTLELQLASSSSSSIVPFFRSCGSFIGHI
jgi:hypothetical protein